MCVTLCCIINLNTNKKMIVEYIKRFYNWYYYIEAKCCNCGKKILVDKNNYIGPNMNYVCSNACMFTFVEKK